MDSPKSPILSEKVQRTSPWIPTARSVSVVAVGLLAAMVNACVSSATQTPAPVGPSTQTAPTVAPTASTTPAPSSQTTPTVAPTTSTVPPSGSAAVDEPTQERLSGARAADLEFPPAKGSTGVPVKKERTDLLAKTAVIYPQNLPLTASVLSEWMSCDVILLYLKAGYSKAQVTQAEASLKAAQLQATSDLDAARMREKRWVEDHLSRDIRPPVLEATSALMPRFEFARVVDMPRDPNRLPPKENPPETLEIHPYQVERTMLEVARRVSWVDILQNWPGGCPAAPQPKADK